MCIKPTAVYKWHRILFQCRCINWDQSFWSIHTSVSVESQRSCRLYAGGCKTTTLQLPWCVRSFHVPLQHQKALSHLCPFKTKGMWCWRPGRESRTRRRRSGLDVREACVGLAAAGWGAQVPGAAALWERRAEMTKSADVRCQTPTLSSHAHTPEMPEWVTWAGERLAGLGFPNERHEISGCHRALLRSAQVAHQPAGPHTWMHHCCQNVCSNCLYIVLTTVHHPPAWSAPPSPRSSPSAPARRPSHSWPLLCICQHTVQSGQKSRRAHV